MKLNPPVPHVLTSNERLTCIVCLSVVFQSYSVNVMDENVLRGNTAIVKCHIPSFVADFVMVDAWIEIEEDEKSEHHYSTQSFGRRILAITLLHMDRSNFKTKDNRATQLVVLSHPCFLCSKFSMGLTAYLIPHDPSSRRFSAWCVWLHGF